MHEIINTFIAVRLLTTNEIAGTTTIEVSHEALIREWPRLAGWLREARQDIRLHNRPSAKMPPSGSSATSLEIVSIVAPNSKRRKPGPGAISQVATRWPFFVPALRSIYALLRV